MSADVENAANPPGEAGADVSKLRKEFGRTKVREMFDPRDHRNP